MQVIVMAGTNVRSRPRLSSVVRFVTPAPLGVDAKPIGDFWVFSLLKCDLIPGTFYSQQANPVDCYVHTSRVTTPTIVAPPGPAAHAIDAALIDFIAQWEGFSPQPYNDPANNATGGYGHLIHFGPLNGHPDEAAWRNLTEAEGKRRLAADITPYAHAVEQYVRVPLTQNQFAALVSFTFNVGQGNLISSQLLAVLNAGNYGEVPGQLMRWIYGSDGNQYPGLIRRRKAEGELWSKP